MRLKTMMQFFTLSPSEQAAEIMKENDKVQAEMKELSAMMHRRESEKEKMEPTNKKFKSNNTSVNPYSETDCENNKENEMMGVATSTAHNFDEDVIWIGKTGASCHLTRVKSGMTNTQRGTPRDEMIMGNGTKAEPEIIGDISGTLFNKDGTAMVQAKLTEVTYSREAEYNLFSISLMLKKGWKLTGTEKAMTLKKGNKW